MPSDRIDLSRIDANGAVAGNQVFVWKGTAAFGLGQVAQLHYHQENAAGTANDKTIIEGDLKSGRIVDFQIEMTGLKTLVGTRR